MEQPTKRASRIDYGSCCMAGMHSSSLHALQPFFLMMLPKDSGTWLHNLMIQSIDPLEWSLKPPKVFFAGICRGQGEMHVQKALAARSLRKWPPLHQAVRSVATSCSALPDPS